MVIFVEIPIFPKIMVKNGGVRRVRNFRPISKSFQNIIFKNIALCSQSFVFIVLLVEEQYGALSDFQKLQPPFFFL
jgi:hypothetical protein